tara:strand:- start:42 stop:323 length:282 start_codon:yes stop_codon:yes gene_type:complete
MGRQNKELIENMEKLDKKDKNAPLPKWFDGEVYENGEIIKNRFGYGEIYCDSHASSMYDLIIGAEAMRMHTVLNKGLSWFRKNYPNEYMVLLD